MKMKEQQSLSNWVLQPVDENETEESKKSATSTSGTAIVHRTNATGFTYTFPSSLVNGIPHPGWITQANWELQRKLVKFRPSDIFISTFSKCGTTLAEQIVLLLLNGGKAEELNPLHKNTLDSSAFTASNKKVVGKIWTEMAVVDGLLEQGEEDEEASTKKACMGEDKARMTLSQFNSLPEPRVLKTHAPPSLFLDSTQKVAKVLYVTRNPFDACVSCYYHPKVGVSPASNGMDFDAFCKLWLSSKVEFGGWIDHTKGWRDEYLNSLPSSMLWISYEELVNQPVESVTKIANFIGVDITTDTSLVTRVVEGSRFDNVKKAAQSILEAGAEGHIDHLRKGQIGDWRSHFSDELFVEFETEIRQRLNGATNEDAANATAAVAANLEYDIGGFMWKTALKGVEDAEEEGDGAVDASSATDENQGSLGTDIVDESRSSTSAMIDMKRLQDIHILGFTMIFYNILQMTLQYVSEFYVDDLRDENGLTQPSNFPAISLVIANVFNGVNGGLSLGTSIFAGRLIRNTYKQTSRFAYYFFISTVIEALVTSGVMHSVAHRLFGATLDGNAYVEFFSHIGYTLNVIASAGLLIQWLAPTYLAANRPGWRSRPYEVLVAVSVSVLAILFTQKWVPYEPNPEDFDYVEDHPYNETRIVLMQRNIQGVIEGLLLIPTILFGFILRRLWTSIQSCDDRDTKLSDTTFRICILSVMIPLLLNWIHFRCHDDLVNSIQSSFGWEHNETIAAIRMIFHIPAWILAIARTHYLRVLTEQSANWPKLDIIESIFPGREVFPFAMIFLYRASEGMTIALLPQFFQGGSGAEYFYLDLVNNTWVAVTVLTMFTVNAIGAIALGGLMQKKGYNFAYSSMCCAFLVVFPLYMIPHSNASFLVLRCLSALLFPGPVVLSKITQNTRQTFQNNFKHIPMVVSLVWFNQGFWFGGVISNSSVWTPWNVFFTSAVVLFTLFAVLFTCYMMSNKKTKEKTIDETIRVAEEAVEGMTDADGNHNELSPLHYMQVNFSSRSDANNESDPEGIHDTRKDSVGVVNAELSRDHKRTLMLARLNSFSGLPPNIELSLSRDHKRTLLLARLASFVNGASFACHISLLPIQVTSLVDLDVYEYTTIVSSLGSISTVLLLLSFRSMARRTISFSMTIAYIGHMIGTAVLCIPQLYSLQLGVAVTSIVTSYGAVLLSFFVMNLSCEVSLGQLRKRVDKDAAAGLQMGIIKSMLSVGKVGGAAMVAFAFRIHPQLHLWILEGLLVFGATLTIVYNFSFKKKHTTESQGSGSFNEVK